MRIGMIDIEPKIHNTAYMQIAGYYRARGDTVEWWMPIGRWDVVFCSSLFDYTDKRGIPKAAIVGGTGFDAKSRLSRQIEDAQPDYSIYPDCEKSYIWFSRGCDRHCPFCVVHDKEGGIHAVAPKNLNPIGEEIIVQDNSFFEGENWRDAIKQLREWRQPVELTNVNVRAITEEQCLAINSLKLRRQVKIAWDNPREDVREQLRMMTNIVKPYKIACYVLIGYWSTPDEDLYRVETLRAMKIDPFVMPYDKHDGYQKRFARWVNHKAIFKTVKWQDYHG